MAVKTMSKVSMFSTCFAVQGATRVSRKLHLEWITKSKILRVKTNPSNLKCLMVGNWTLCLILAKHIS